LFILGKAEESPESFFNALKENQVQKTGVTVSCGLQQHRIIARVDPV
jgi:hypothetical protein